MHELARRFSLEHVGHSAGVFDEEKLAWVNRRYLKMADPRRLAELSVRYFVQAGIAMTPAPRGLEFLASAMVMASASVDRLNQVPARLAFLFDYDANAALADPQTVAEMRGDGARAVAAALAEELAASPRLDREVFRDVTNRAVKANAGHVAVSVMPVVNDGSSTAEVALMKGDERKVVARSCRRMQGSQPLSATASAPPRLCARLGR